MQEMLSFKVLLDFIYYLDDNLQLKIVFINLLKELYIDVYYFSPQSYISPLRFLNNTNIKVKNRQIQGNQKGQEVDFESSDSDLSVINEIDAPKQSKQRFSHIQNLNFKEPEN